MIENPEQLRATSEQLLEQLTRLGATDAESSISVDDGRQVAIKDSAIETAESATSRTISLRAYVGKRSATTTLSYDPDADYANQLSDLIIAAKAGPEDPFIGLAEPGQLANVPERDFDQFDYKTPLMGINDLKERAVALENAAMGTNLRVDQASVSHGHVVTDYLATNGLNFTAKRSFMSQGTVVIHDGTSLVRDFASDSKIHFEDIESVTETGNRARERTRAAANPIRPPSGRYPIMFDQRVARSLISHVLGAMNGSALARRASWLIDYDEDILPNDWRLVETPFINRRSASAVLDGDGLAKRETTLIENGRAQLWMANLAVARQLEIEPTGHAQRAGVTTGAGISMAKLEAPMVTRDALLSKMGEGLLVTGFIGATINAHTGDYSRGVNGFWIKNGEIQYAVNEATIAGNLKTMLPTMHAADDIDLDHNLLIPSLLVEEMTIAGA